MPACLTTRDIRDQVLDSANMRPAHADALHGLACARCGSTTGLRPGGYSYTRCREGGQLGWPVRVCGDCPAWGADS